MQNQHKLKLNPFLGHAQATCKVRKIFVTYRCNEWLLGNGPRLNLYFKVSLDFVYSVTRYTNVAPVMNSWYRIPDGQDLLSFLEMIWPENKNLYYRFSESDKKFNFRKRVYPEFFAQKISLSSLYHVSRGFGIPFTEQFKVKDLAAKVWMYWGLGSSHSSLNDTRRFFLTVIASSSFTPIV